MIDRVFEEGHPATLGHFPGNPIVPGALLLSEALDAIARDIGGAPLEVRAAKFPSPTRPGERIVIRYDRGASGTVRFTCSVEGRLVLAGEASCVGSQTAS